MRAIAESFSLSLHDLESRKDRTLVLSEVAGRQSLDGYFQPAEVAQLFSAFHVPGPGNPSDALSNLAASEYVMRRTSPRGWAVTPRGRRRIAQLIGAIDSAAVEAQLTTQSGAEFGNARHTLLPPALAPAKWRVGIDRMLGQSEFDRNVFCMTRFPSKEDDPKHYLDPISTVVGAIRGALSSHGLALHLASDRKIDDDLYGNVAAHMWACRFGVALFEQRIHAHLNHNLAIEVGSMLMTGRRCELLRDRTVAAMPTDLVGQIYTSVDFDDAQGVGDAMHEWAAKSLGLGACPSCPAEP